MIPVTPFTEKDVMENVNLILNYFVADDKNVLCVSTIQHFFLCCISESRITSRVYNLLFGMNTQSPKTTESLLVLFLM